MGRRLDHESLISRGLELHEARRYTAALPYFERALRLDPDCLVAVYNRANTLHMLGRDEEAYPLLRGLIEVSPEELRRRCPAGDPRGLQLDAYMLLFWVVLHGRGFCAEAFAYAAEHLRRRCRGVHSVWSAREVRADIAAMHREWQQAAPNQPLHLTAPASRPSRTQRSLTPRGR
jgi:tetratricopeptide (TPR) repeat protein